MKKTRLFIGFTTLILAVVFIANNLLGIMWGLLSMDESDLGTPQIIIVSIVLMTAGVVSIIYHDIKTFSFRLAQFALYLGGTVLTVFMVNSADIFCSIIKLWLCVSTIVMLLVLCADRPGKEVSVRETGAKDRKVYKGVLSSKWTEGSSVNPFAEYCPFCGKKTIVETVGHTSSYFSCRTCGAEYKVLAHSETQ